MIRQAKRFRSHRCRDYIFEIDALQGLFNMQRPRLTGVIDAIPIEKAISGVAVLLHLNQNIACANGVKSAGGQEHCVASLHRDSMDTFGNCSGMERALELLPRYALTQTDVDFRARLRCGHVPEFRLCFAA